jgi:glycosyltransferase involved in cell wall biosynthesis
LRRLLARPPPQAFRSLISDSPLISIVIPCHNAERWVADTIESCLAQTWRAREVILINDGSSDGSLDVLRRFESPDVRVHDQPNLGASAARNAGLRDARGAFIQFIDADDILAPEKLERQMSLFSARPKAQLISGEWARFTGNAANTEFTLQPNGRDMTAVEFLQLFFETGAMMHPAAWLARRTLIEAAGPWNEGLSLNDDGEYFARVMIKAGSIDFCPGARSYYRSHPDGSLSGRKDSQALESLYRSFDLQLSYLSAADNSRRTKAAIAYGWKWLAFELYPGRPDLADAAEHHARTLGWSERPFPGSGRFQIMARFLGWRLAKRLLRN